MSFWEVTLGGLLGSGVATTLVGAILTRRNARLAGEVKSHFDEQLLSFTTTRAYRQAALYELFGPLKMQLVRTKSAFDRWKGRSDHLEGEVIRKANEAVRDLLLAKGHLIPPHLVKPASQLIEHYDAWLEKYEQLRGEHSDSTETYVFVAPDGYGFPREAERLILKHTDELQRLLFGESIRPD